jgi:hypothetical protein
MANERAYYVKKTDSDDIYTATSDFLMKKTVFDNKKDPQRSNWAKGR